MKILIHKCPERDRWYFNRVREVFVVEHVELNKHPDQGIPDDVFWVRTGDAYNTLNYVLVSDAALA